MKYPPALASALAVCALVPSSVAFAQSATTEPTFARLDARDGTAGTDASSANDPTGGAYTSPTLLFIPAAAVPTLTVRVIPSAIVQSPSDVHAGVQPGLGAEIGLSHGVTFGAGTNWVGGDINPDNGKTDFALGLSPYFQVRVHLAGAKDGMGWQLGTAATYKFVGFGAGTSAGQDPGEIELSLSAQYRHPRYELGLQGALGQDFGDSKNHDGEVHLYALYRLIPELGVGAAGQVRMAIGPDATDPNAPPAYDDVMGGGIASLTLGRYQLGALAGVSTIGIAPDRPSDLAKPGGAGQLFASFRFN
jgi:hypothetical protein